MSDRYHFFDPPEWSLDLETDAINNIERAGNSVNSEDRVSMLRALAQFASAAEPDKVDRLLNALVKHNGRSTTFSLAFELFSAHMALRHEDYALAKGHADRGRTLAISVGREADASAFCMVQGTIEYRSGRYSDARNHFEEAVVSARRAASRDLEAQALMNLGLVLKNSGDLSESERLLRMARELASDCGSSASAARYELNLANVLIRRGAWREALKYADSAASALNQGGLLGYANSARLVKARAMRLLGDPRGARDQLEFILNEAKALSKPRNVVLALEFLGDCELDCQRPEQAREHYREALILARGLGRATDLVLECLRGLSAAELACAESELARKHAEESVTIAREQGDTFELSTSLIVLAKALASLGESSAELAALEEARELSGRVGDDHGRAQSAYGLALHASELGRSLEAISLAAEAHRLALRIGARTLAAAAESLLTKPSTVLSHRETPQRASQPRSRPPADSSVSGFLTTDSRLKRTLTIVKQLSSRRLNILILGESGTGKELIAQAVHGESGRKGPFVPVNCSAFPGDLIEGELFGHARGAYTGADRERVGLFEFANKGTLFLDEIGDMPIKAQARLLRALESGEVRRLGENSPRLVDVRVVAATHRDLMTMVGAGEFRLDLYYRLAGYVVELPPLRERVEDVKLLIDHYFAKFAGEQGKALTMAPEVRQQLASYSWPGNVRELKLVMDRLVSLSEDRAVIRSLPFVLEGTPSPRSLPELLEAEEKRRILEALQSHNWNKQRAAMTLGTNRTTLIGKMKRMGIASRKP